MNNKNIIIVDIDGTISKVGDRIKYLKQKPKDYDSFYKDTFNDEPIMEIVELVQDLFYTFNDIVFCTGRRESCREQTMNWLKKYFTSGLVDSCLLLMRPNNDTRHDTIVKPILLYEAGIELSNIKFVLEDRNSMVAKWRELGLICLQVAEGDF